MNVAKHFQSYSLETLHGNADHKSGVQRLLNIFSSRLHFRCGHLKVDCPCLRRHRADAYRGEGCGPGASRGRIPT